MFVTSAGWWFNASINRIEVSMNGSSRLCKELTMELLHKLFTIRYAALGLGAQVRHVRAVGQRDTVVCFVLFTFSRYSQVPLVVSWWPYISQGVLRHPQLSLSDLRCRQVSPGNVLMSHPGWKQEQLCRLGGYSNQGSGIRRWRVNRYARETVLKYKWFNYLYKAFLQSYTV